MTGPAHPPSERRSLAGAGASTQPESFAEAVYRILDDKRAEEIVWLDVRGITDLADSFLIATIHNTRQGSAILDACDLECRRRGHVRLGVEGETGSTWILLDYGDLIVHMLMPEQRAYYALEHLWADAKRLR